MGPGNNPEGGAMRNALRSRGQQERKRQIGVNKKGLIGDSPLEGRPEATGESSRDDPRERGYERLLQ